MRQTLWYDTDGRGNEKGVSMVRLALFLKLKLVRVFVYIIILFPFVIVLLISVQSCPLTLIRTLRSRSHISVFYVTSVVCRLTLHLAFHYHMLFFHNSGGGEKLLKFLENSFMFIILVSSLSTLRYQHTPKFISLKKNIFRCC